MAITRKQLIKLYLEFFKSKNHKEIPNVSLIPENDPTVLFTTAGMHPLVPYLLGNPHPHGKRLVNVQKCIRTQDIDDVGDSYHHTFFEMLGNWSLGDYFKKQAIEYSFEFLTKILKIPIEKLAVSVFKGDKDAPKDEESAEVWESLEIPKERIAFLPKSDNWWGPAGKTGPCGPDTEMFFWKPKNIPTPKIFYSDDENWVEIWNDVLMQYNKDRRLILVDGMDCLYDENFKINKELLQMINSFNTHTILTVNGFREKGIKLVKNYDSARDTNWEAFSLEEKGIMKDNHEYFKVLLKRFNLEAEEVIYIDHSQENLEGAKKSGIDKTILFKNNIKEIKNFIENNLDYYLEAKQKNIDTGMGVERTITVLNNLEDDYLSETFLPIIKEIEKLSGLKYSDEKNKKPMRIIADHIKASCFIITDEITPSNLEQGYVLRRLIRRAIRYGRQLNIKNFTAKIAEPIFRIYEDYQHLQKNKTQIIEELEKEENRFLETLEKGINIFNKLTKQSKKLSGKDAFLLCQSYGFPIEITLELAKEKNIKVDETSYQKELQKHQELSRTATQGKFKSGLADNSEQTTKLHTATHLLAEALRVVLKKPDLIQKGSNITPERLRFDFNFDRKLTESEIKKVEELVNKKIQEKIPVIKKEMTLEQAKKFGAQGVFEHKYGDKIFVYSVGDFSKEICAGPHVKNTEELGKFKILKEESSSAGVRRIKAILETV